MARSWQSFDDFLAQEPEVKIVTKAEWEARYVTIHDMWLHSSDGWRSTLNLAGLHGDAEWTCGQEQTWAIWKGLAEKPKGWPH